MAKIYGQTGSLTQLIDEFARAGMGAFESMDDIRSFRDNCRNSINHIRKHCSEILKKEVVDLESQCRQLSLNIDHEIKERDAFLRNVLKETKEALAENESRNMLMRLFFYFRKRKLTRRRNVLENSFEKVLRKPFRKVFAKIDSIRAEIDDRKNNVKDWVEYYAASDIKKQQKILAFFEKHTYLFYGAEGEERVIRELSRLPDEYAVIDDYKLKFSRPMYDRNNDDRIYSIQIDHVVVGPTGLYLVETKNWSKGSVDSPELFSPIRQLRRGNFAVFVLLNQAVERGDIDNFSDHWGDRKISPKMILCLVNHKPNQEYQYVKTLSVGQTASYITSQRQVFSQKEVMSLIEYLRGG